ncbi:hypothetical protein [Streptomyces sp. I05A-00742]|uniref:hypothetical protein n=1 Tax=Streptomyces sp. I05A-00742 TaxID=2732853 RepID=UPI00148989AD|nr:hypothetical protein [Streptomyces sp. I05A-00742]
MRKRLPLLAVCLTAAAFGASACGGSDDSGSGSSAASASAPASASAAPSGNPSAAPAELRGLTGLSAKLYLRAVRKRQPELDRISDDTLLAHGNALCLASGQDFVDQAIKTKQELQLTGKQASAVLGLAHGACGRNVFGTAKD